MLIAIGLWLWARRRQAQTGQRFAACSGRRCWRSSGCRSSPIFAAGSPLGLDYPELKGFNFQGGIAVLPELMALLLGLSIYTASFIAEIVRAGILGVPKGQTEAAQAIGLTAGRRCAWW